MNWKRITSSISIEEEFLSEIWLLWSNSVSKDLLEKQKTNFPIEIFVKSVGAEADKLLAYGNDILDHLNR